MPMRFEDDINTFLSVPSAAVQTSLEQARKPPPGEGLPTKCPTALDTMGTNSTKLPDWERMMRQRQALGRVINMLEEVDTTLLDTLQESDADPDADPDTQRSSWSVGKQPINPLALSIDLSLAELQRSTRALCQLVSKYRPSKQEENQDPGFASGCIEGGDRATVNISAAGEVYCPREVSPQVLRDGEPLTSEALTTSVPDPATPDQSPRWQLPTPDLGDAFGKATPREDGTCSAQIRDSSGDFTSSSPALQDDDQDYDLLPVTSPLCVPPLRLSGRSLPAGSTPSLVFRNEHDEDDVLSSPFEYELGYLERQLSEVSDPGCLDYFDHHFNTVQKPPQLRSVKSSESMRDRYRFSLGPLSGNGAPGGMNESGTPRRGRLSAAAPARLESIGEFEPALFAVGPNGSQSGWQSRYFSTQEKTRRLRSMRRGSATTSREAESNEPLRMEELMSYLREGNGIRGL